MTRGCRSKDYQMEEREIDREEEKEREMKKSG